MADVVIYEYRFPDKNRKTVSMMYASCPRCGTIEIPGLVGLSLCKVSSSLLVALDMASLESALLFVIPGNGSSEIVSLPLPSRNPGLHHEADCQSRSTTKKALT